MIGFRSQIQENDLFLLPNKNGFHCKLKKLGYCCQMKNNLILLSISKKMLGFLFQRKCLVDQMKIKITWLLLPNEIKNTWF